jgi:hypothetical protein
MLHIYNLFQRKQVVFFEHEIFEQNLKHLNFENSQLFLNMKTWFNVQGKARMANFTCVNNLINT